MSGWDPIETRAMLRSIIEDKNNSYKFKYDVGEFTWISVKEKDKKINTANEQITGDYIEAHQLVLADPNGMDGVHNILRFAITTDPPESENNRTLYLQRVLNTSKEDSKLQKVSNWAKWGLLYKKLNDGEMIAINLMKKQIRVENPEDAENQSIVEHAVDNVIKEYFFMTNVGPTA
jgi:hypothetical protein